jgi:hypothetical protein
LWPFVGIFYGHLVNVFPPFWYIVPRIIWQTWTWAELAMIFYRFDQRTVCMYICMYLGKVVLRWTSSVVTALAWQVASWDVLQPASSDFTAWQEQQWLMCTLNIGGTKDGHILSIPIGRRKGKENLQRPCGVE